MINDKSFCVYIMTNKNNTVLYTGVTNDLRRRVLEHKTGKGGGFTADTNVLSLRGTKQSNPFSIISAFHQA